MTAATVRPTRLRVDLEAVRHNVRRLADAAPGAEVCAVVKGDAYGHGAVPVARAALEAGAAWLGVALVEEGRELRVAGIDAPLLLLSEPPAAAAPAVVAAGLTPVVYRPTFLAALDATAATADLAGPLPIHLKADTGMGRVGARPEHWEALLAQAVATRHLVVDGLMTHLACADEPEREITGEQLAAFERFVAAATAAGATPRWVHAANTAATLLHPAAHHGLVRPGIGIYGLSPAADVDAADHDLWPVASLISEVAFVKRVPAGTPISYGHRFHAPVDGWVATVPIGYADGVPRRLTGVGEVLLGGRRRPIAGTITMDQLMVWCPDEADGDGPDIGDEVVLIGRQGREQLRAEDWAAHLGTITYEVTSQLTARVPRVHLGARGA